MFRDEVNVLVMAEKRIDVVGIGQNIAAPTIQHCHLQERCEVFRLILEKQVARRLVKQAMVAVGLASFVIQVPVLAARPNTPLRDPQQGRRYVNELAIE